MKEQELVAWGFQDRSSYLKHLWRKYRISNIHVDAMWKKQKGLCAGCSVELAHPWERNPDNMKRGVKPQIDHRHVPGVEQCEAKDVRGLLCGRCNNFLGKIADDLPLLQNLVGYLKAHGDWYGS